MRWLGIVFALWASPALAYSGVCDALTTSTCAEGWSLSRALTVKYNGPLFQLTLASNHALTLDVGQTAAHVADMTTWSTFCGGVQSNCLITKIYAQFHGSANDAVAAAWGQICGSGLGPYGCAAPFAINGTTGFAELNLVQPYTYTANADNALTGVSGGTGNISVMVNGKNVNELHQCCGSFGLGHKYTLPDTQGTDFSIVYAEGTGGIAPCGGAFYCMGSDLEGAGNGGPSIGLSPKNVIGLSETNAAGTRAVGITNGTTLWDTTPATAINAGTSLRFGAGGDLSQPASFTFREGFISNDFVSACDAQIALMNMETFYSQLTFPP